MTASGDRRSGLRRSRAPLREARCDGGSRSTTRRRNRTSVSASTGSASTPSAITYVAADFATDDVAVALARSRLRPRTRRRSSSAKASRCTSSDRCSSPLLRSIRAVARRAFTARHQPVHDARQRRSRGSPGVVPRTRRGGRRARARPAHAPKSALASSRTRGGKTRPPARALSTRDWWSCHLLMRRWRQPPKTPLLPSMSKTSPVRTWEPFDASYWPISAYSMP